MILIDLDLFFEITAVPNAFERPKRFYYEVDADSLLEKSYVFLGSIGAMEVKSSITVLEVVRLYLEKQNPSKLSELGAEIPPEILENAMFFFKENYTDKCFKAIKEEG